MRNLAVGQPSPAMAVAFLALLAALSGTAVALPGTSSVDSGDIDNNTVRSRDLRNNDVRTQDIRNSTVRGRDVRNNSLTGDDVQESSLGEVPLSSNARNALNAVRALSATSATSANTAGNAGTLDAVDSTGFYRYGSSIPSGTTVFGAFGDIGAPGADDADPDARQEDAVSLPVPAPVPLDDDDVNFGSDSIGADDDTDCTGDAENPTAPPGKVCLYRLDIYNGTPANSITGESLGTDDPSRFGFRVESQLEGNPYAGAMGVWAYTAP